MALSGNEIEKWAHRRGGSVGELVEPAAPPDSVCLSPETSLGSAEHPLHLPGQADSAYSSFSGGSNVPEYHAPSCCGEKCSPAEQVPYMDSEYVRGIYNLSAASSALRCLHLYEAPDLSAPGDSHGHGPAERSGSTPSRGTEGQGPLPLAAPPPSPPARLDSYRVARHLESTRGRHSSGGRSEHGMQPARCAQDGRPAGERVSRSHAGGDAGEADPAAARRRTLENKGAPSGSSNGVSMSEIQGLRTEGNGEWSPSQKPVKRSKPHVYSRPSSFIFQEYLRTDSVANVPKILSAYSSAHAHKIPEEMKSKSYPAVHTIPGTAGDAPEGQQYPCGVRKPAFRAADLQRTVPEASQRRGSLLCARCPLRAKLHSDLDQDVFEDVCDLKYVENALLIKHASRKLNSCADENQCCDHKGEIGSDVRGPLPNLQAKTQKSSLSCSSDTAELEYPRSGELDHGNKQGCDNTEQTAFLRPKEDSTSPSSDEVRKEKQAANSSPDLNMHLEQEEPPVPYQKYQPELEKQLLRQPQHDLPGEHINRQTTPMLYYLSGGKATNILHHSKPTQCHEGSRSSPKELPASSHTARVQSIEAQRESDQLPKASHQQPCADGDLNEAEDVVLGSPASSMDESFKNDYREKLKVAQKKVLRETSFKRKDLQMSLPVRLRQKPSKRPSIEHFRSFSLSSAHEDAKLAPCSPSHLESLESFNRGEETKRPQTGRTGGRKRATKEEKKLCYSEPEKLNLLADKEVPWNRVSDETAGQDAGADRRQTPGNRGRALSSSSVSRMELKQIQHTALIEYMERKISQRPGSTQHVPLHKPPLQKRPSHPKWPPGKISSPNGSRKMQSDEVFSEEGPGVFPPPALVPPPNAASRCGMVPTKPSQRPAAADRSCSPQSVPVGSLPQAGAAAPAAQGWEPGPPSMQGADRCASCAVSPSCCESHLSTPSSHDSEQDGCQDHEHQDSDGTGSSWCQDTEELAPETSVPSPRSRSEEDARVQKECSTGDLAGSASTSHPEQQPLASDTAAPQDRAVRCHPSLARPHQGDRSTAPGLAAQEAAPRSSQDDALQEGETSLPRKRLWSPEDQRYEELAMELVAKDSSLVDVLMPHPVRKTALDLMEGLFPVNVSMLETHRRKADAQKKDSRKSSRDVAEESPESELAAQQSSEGPTPQGNQAPTRSGDDTKDLDDITCKKLELISSLRSRLRALWEDKELILSEARACAERGQDLEATVRDVCKPNEFERYMMFIGDLEKVVSLLLCLSSRLARVQNAMRKVDGSTDAEEKQSLNERHKLLSRQREDAKDLKENLDRRERVVSGILAKYLTDQQLQDYRRFVQVKTSLLIEQKDLEEQIRFFEEQLENLEKSIPL